MGNATTDVTRTHNPVRLMALLLALSATGCAGAGMTLMGAGTGVAASTGVNYSLNGIAYKTFTAPSDDVHSAALLTFRRMGMEIQEDRVTKEGYALRAKAVDREIFMEVERVTKRTTRVRVNVDKGEIFKDRATATEIIVQAAYMLEDDMGIKKMQAQAKK